MTEARTPFRRPIFILGMLQRTGTNHLWDMFGLHPDVALAEPVFEDHLVRWSPHLLAYVDDVSRCWTEDWEVPASESAALLRSLGDGIASWVAGHSDRRVVTKMPSIENAERFFDIFGDCPLVVLVRDGRSVCESGVKSFGWSYERAFDRWTRAADVVLDVQRVANGRPFAVVRYEDLVERPADTMRHLCEVTGLDPEQYPYEQIDALPVRGSSTLRTESGTDVHWVPVERTADFDPRERWRSWDDHLHRRFAQVAGSQQRALGYDLLEVGGSDTVLERLSDARHLAEVRVRAARVKIGRARRAVSRVQGRI